MKFEMPLDETRPHSLAVSVTAVHKRYRLGELQSLRHTLRRLVGRDGASASLTVDALAGVDLAVGRGEAIGIVGTNGSGKSTMLQILAGITLPTSGRIWVQGRVLPLLAVGMGSGFHPELTGRENVTLFASSLRIPPKIISSRMQAVAEFGDLQRHMDTPVKHFSSGMAARLSFAIAMQFPADVYIFDEVLAMVDGEFQARCLQELKTLHARGRTLIFVSHRSEQIVELCERVAWLENGRLKQVGATEDVVPAYEASLREHLSAT
jgi:ABC-type polysaccharide/polyol phosphate transport system ATPase subunit